MNINEHIKELIYQSVMKIRPDIDFMFSVPGAGNSLAVITIERPADMSHGDFSTNFAMVASKKIGINPVELANNIIENIKSDIFEKVEVAGPGFINFYLTQDASFNLLKEISEKGIDYGKNNFLAGQKVIYEYTDPNPFKQFHIGHLMSNAVGEALSRLGQYSGADVKRYCYQGDVGRHVALTFYGYKLLGETWPSEDVSLSDKVAFLGRIYAKGATHFKVHPGDEARVQELNKKIYHRSDIELNKLYDQGKQWSLAHFEELYKILGTKFDEYFFESDATPIGLSEVEKGLEKGTFERSEGAVIFRGENYGLNTRVFINKFGLPTYEAKEIGLALLKYNKEPYYLSYTITANEQNNVLAVAYKAIEQIYPDIVKKNIHLAHGMLRLPTGKMSSRTGDVTTGESLLNDMIQMALSKMEDRNINEAERLEISEQIAVAAIKYTILKQSIGKDIVFDPQKSLSFEGDSGPYLQYSCVRANSILEKAQTLGHTPSLDINTKDLGVCSLNWAGGKLEKLLVRFEEVVLRAQIEKAPHLVAQYILELASEFNSFYANSQIIVEGDLLTSYRLTLVKLFLAILTNGLDILGIKVPKRM